MARKKRSSPQGAPGSHDWLRRESARSRPWAYEELLFGSNEETFEGEWLDSFAAGLAVDLAELRRMQNELYEQVVRVAALEGRIQAMRRLVDSGRLVQAEETGPEPKVPSLPSAPVSAWRSTDRGYSLARSEGFRVDSPSGFVGFVEGLRFVSRIDEPDLLEVRSGRFGRELMLIPIEAVGEISPAEQRLVIRATPPPQADHLHELVARFRHVVSASVHHVVR